MKFEEVLPALKEGKKIRKRKEVNEGDYYVLDKKGIIHVYSDYGKIRTCFTYGDIMNEDWEIVKEIKKVKLRDLTAQQYKTFVDKKCGNQIVGIGCVGCPFYHISCLYGKDNRCWIDNKDLYSDKFLDQEIEIEEE